jgi:hypothetical protein
MRVLREYLGGALLVKEAADLEEPQLLEMEVVRHRLVEPGSVLLQPPSFIFLE